MTTQTCRRRLIAVVLCVLTMSGCGIGGPPSDAEMIAHLHRERVAFDTLVRMMAEDGVVGQLAIDSMPGSSPERSARRDTYRRLLQRTGRGSVFRDPAGRVTFDVPYPTSGGGVAGTGFKSYVYSATLPSPLRPSLDDSPGERFEDNFRHVDGRWFLCRARV